MKLLSLALAALGFAAVTQAQQFDNPVSIPIDFYATGVTNGTNCSFVFGQGLSATASGSGSGTGTYIYSPQTIAMVVPGVIYNVTVTSSKCMAVMGNFQPIDGCNFYINGNKSQYVSGPPNYSFTLRVETMNDLATSLTGHRGGDCCSFPEDKPIWYIGLGSLTNGQFAGAVGFRATDITSSLYNTSQLVCGNVDPTQISITRDGNGYITQINAPSVQLNFDAYNPSGTSYSIRVYQSGNLNTPYITYTISQYGSGGIRIDRLEDGANWSTVLQEVAIQRGPTTWTLYDWQLMAPGATTFANAIGTLVNGTATINYGSGNGAFTKTKTYVSVNGRGELASAAMGVGSVSSPPTTTYSYYSSSSGSGWSGAVQSIIQPTGNWTAYDYYNGSTDARAGEIWHTYRPWINAPATPSEIVTSGLVHTYNYTTNYDGTQSALASDITSINGTQTGETTWTYNWNYATVNGHTIASVVEDSYSSSSAYLVTITLLYPQNDPTSFFWKRPHSVTRPDGTKDSYAYYQGTWNPSSNTFTQGAGSSWMVLAFHGQVGSGISSWKVGSSTWTLDTIALTANLSTVTETVVDPSGRVVLKCENVFTTGNSIAPISSTAYTYYGNNLLQAQTDLMRSVSGGTVAVNYTYLAGFLQTKTDIDGVETQCGYDNFGHVQTITTAERATNNNYPATTQNFTYYTSGLENTGQENPRDPTTTTYTYDGAGRILSASVPAPELGGGTLTTNWSYPTLLQTTVTLPTGATKITYLNLDGRASEQGGTGQVDTRYGWSYDSNYIYANTQVGPDQSNGWSEVKTDWLGRTITLRTPEVGWSSGSFKVVRKTYNYSGTTGQLLSVSTNDEGNGMAPLLPTHIYVFGNQGMLIEEGDDVDNSGSLTTSSIDRIVLYSTSYSKDSTYNGWVKNDTTQIYNTLNNGSSLSTSNKITRFTQFNGGALYQGGAVISDVATIDTSGRQISDWEWVAPGSHTRTHQQAIQGVNNPAMTYWQDGYLMTTCSCSNVINTYQYYASGQLDTITEASGATTTYTYWPNTAYQESVTQTTGANNSLAGMNYAYTWSTTRNSTTVTATDSANNVTNSEFNALGLLWDTWGTAVLPSQINYDNYGRRTGITTWQTGSCWAGSTWPAGPPAGNLVSWQLDPASGLPMSKTFPDGSLVQFTYNARGQPLTRIWARKVTTTYSYFDTVGVQTGELKQVAYSDGTPTMTYTYTRWGAPATISDASGSRTFGYRVSGTTDDLKLSTETLDSSFYNGRILTTNYDASVPGRATGYSFNGGITVGLTDGFDPSTGHVNSIKGISNGANTTFNLYYANGQTPSGVNWGTDWVNSVTNGSYARSLPLVTDYDTIAAANTTWGSTQMGSFTAQYTDVRGWRNGQTDNSSAYMTAFNLGTVTNNYQFDGFGQLTTINSAVNWTYDYAGNRLTDTSNGGSTNYTPGSLNQYSSITGTLGENPLSYDSDGNLSSDGTWTYSYDGENRLSSMSRRDGTQTLTFKYDFLGRRIRKTVTGTNASDTKFVWYGWSLVADLNADGYDIIRSYIWGPDFSDVRGSAGGAGALLGIYNNPGSALTFAMPDALGNIVGYINTSGSLTAAVEYTPFGLPLNVIGSQGSYPIGFSGQYTDWETGLVYYGLRYYSPKHGRFINRDPIEEAGGLNLYGFCRNNPINIADSLGLTPGPTVTFSGRYKQIVTITVNVIFDGGTVAQQQTFITAIQSGWSGQIGPYTVTTNVTTQFGNPDSLMVRFVACSPGIASDNDLGYCPSPDLIYLRADMPSNRLAFVSQHEFGHSLGLPHFPAKDDIMHSPASEAIANGAHVTANDIRGIKLRSGTTTFEGLFEKEDDDGSLTTVPESAYTTPGPIVEMEPFVVNGSSPSEPSDTIFVPMSTLEVDLAAQQDALVGWGHIDPITGQIMGDQLWDSSADDEFTKQLEEIQNLLGPKNKLK
jgi:RHS repeat-associated protein